MLHKNVIQASLTVDCLEPAVTVLIKMTTHCKKGANKSENQLISQTIKKAN